MTLNVHIFHLFHLLTFTLFLLVVVDISAKKMKQ